MVFETFCVTVRKCKRILEIKWLYQLWNSQKTEYATIKIKVLGTKKNTHKIKWTLKKQTK